MQITSREDENESPLYSPDINMNIVNDVDDSGTHDRSVVATGQ